MLYNQTNNTMWVVLRYRIFHIRNICSRYVIQPAHHCLEICRTFITLPLPLIPMLACYYIFCLLLDYPVRPNVICYPYHMLLTWEIQLLTGLAQYFTSWRRTFLSLKALDAVPYDPDGNYYTIQGVSMWFLPWSWDQCITEYEPCAHFGGIQNNADEDFYKI